MRIINFLLASLFLILFSCNTNSDTSSSTTAGIPVTHRQQASGEVKTTASLSIEGMTCAAGCGGKIQQELREIPGVITTSLDFSEGREQNIVSVQYDPSKTNEQKMIECVHAIETPFHVKSVEVVEFGLASTSQGSSGGSGIKLYDFSKVMQLMGLFQGLFNLVK
jgi:periplasmic mercuric ion binding protein